MGEILPDGSIQSYSKICDKCKKTIRCNIQGCEIDSHVCEHPLSPGSDVKNEIHVIDLSEFCINMSDVERAFCFGYISNPDNNCLDNVEMMKRWNNFKNNYLEPRYGQ